MTKQEMIDVLAKYRRPVSPVYDYHFQKLPSEIIQKENVPALLAILKDASLPAIVRENAAGALGEIGDERAVRPLIEALKETRIRRGVAIALGRMKAEEAAEVLKELASQAKPRRGAARWALSQLERPPRTAEDVIESLRSGQLRQIPHKLRLLPNSLRRKVEAEVVRKFKDALEHDKDHEDLRWYVTALTTFHHSDAPTLLVQTLERSWKLLGPWVGLQTQRTCCGCLHNRTLRALKKNPSLDAVPNLVETITNRYQRHATMALKRLRELGGGGLSDWQIARMVEKNAAIHDQIGSQRQHIQVITQLIRFAGDYGGKDCKRTLENLRRQFSSESPAQVIETAIRSIDVRLQQ